MIPLYLAYYAAKPAPLDDTSCNPVRLGSAAFSCSEGFIRFSFPIERMKAYPLLPPSQAQRPTHPHHRRLFAMRCPLRFNRGERKDLATFKLRVLRSGPRLIKISRPSLWPPDGRSSLPVSRLPQAARSSPHGLESYSESVARSPSYLYRTTKPLEIFSSQGVNPRSSKKTKKLLGGFTLPYVSKRFMWGAPFTPRNFF